MILGIATSSPPPQLLILTWPTICHFILVNTWPVICPWPRTWQVVTTRGKLSTGHRLSTHIKLSSRGKLSKSVLRIQMIKSHMFGKLSQVHIQDSTAWEHGRGNTVVTTRPCSQQCWLLQLFWRLIWISEFSVTTFPEWLDTKSPNLHQLDFYIFMLFSTYLCVACCHSQ